MFFDLMKNNLLNIVQKFLWKTFFAIFFFKNSIPESSLKLYQFTKSCYVHFLARTSFAFPKKKAMFIFPPVPFGPYNDKHICVSMYVSMCQCMCQCMNQTMWFPVWNTTNYWYWPFITSKANVKSRQMFQIGKSLGRQKSG